LFIGIKIALFDVRQKAVGDFYREILNSVIVVGVTRFKKKRKNQKVKK